MKRKSKLLFSILLFLASFLSCADGAKSKQPASPGVSAVYVAEGLGEITPGSRLWAKAPEAVVDMLPQDLTEPKLMQGVTSIKVKSLCDQNRVAFRISWADTTRDEMDESDMFSDAAAVQLPLAAGPDVPDPTMGMTGRPVHIHLWKASYQKRLEAGGWNLRDMFPNASVDHYPSDAASEEAREEIANQYIVGLAAANPLATARKSCVDDMTAESFGTLTFLPAQFSNGRGEWRDGAWSVVITRPLAVAEWNAGMKPGDKTFAAFAVWDGSKGQAGSRKTRSAWVPLRLEKKA